MNLFILDEEPIKIAEYHCDKHVVKQIVETAQMLSVAHRVLDGYQTTELSKSGKTNRKVWRLDDEYLDDLLYKTAHVNHPCTIWIRECSANYNFAWSIFAMLSAEFVHRFGKTHGSWDKLAAALSHLPKNITMTKRRTPFEVCINEDIYPGCKDIKNPLASYRKYYNVKNIQQFKMKWTNREIPYFMEK